MNRAKLLSHIGRHQKTHLIYSVAVQCFFFEIDLKADLSHVKLPQFRQDLLLHFLCSSFSALRQHLRCLPRSLFRFCQPLFQLQQRISCIFNRIQFLPALIQISQHFPHGGTIFLFQAIQLIHPPFYLIKLRGRKIEILALVLNGIRQIIHLAVSRFQPSAQLLIAFVKPAHGSKMLQRLPQQAHRAIAAVIAAEAVVCAFHGCNKLFTVAQKTAAGSQFLLLAFLYFCSFQLVDLKAQRIYPALLFSLIHLQSAYLSPQFLHCVEGSPVRVQQWLNLPKAIQIEDMLFLVQQLLAIMLAMNIQQSASQRAQLRHSHRPPIAAADIFSVRMNFPLQQ